MKKTSIIALKVGLGILALLFTLGNNCITSGNVVVVMDLDPVNGQTEQHFNPVSVDLKTNSDWNDHKEQLNSVDDIGFACKITNNTSSVATGQVWISEKSYTTPADVQEHAVKILDGIVVPADGIKTVNWGESAGYLSNFNLAKAIVYGEVFYLYFMAENVPFDINVTDIVLFLSINGKP